MRLFPIAAAALAATAILAVALPRAGEAQDKAEFVGDKACQKCHFQQHKSWKKTGLAKAMKTLEPTTEADNKELFAKKKAANLDPAKDYTTDATCLKCHTTGYGEPGGYPADPKKDEAAGKLAAARGSVGCESCHGAGSLYVKHKTAEVEKNKDAKFPFEDLAKLGMKKPDEANCTSCHNDQSPTKEPFKFDDAKTKMHDLPKKQ
jgi:hypothetical protein